MSDQSTTAVSVREQKRNKIINNPELMDQILQVVPKGTDPKALVYRAWAAITTNPDLLDCTVASIAKSIRQAAEIGIDPTGALGQGWLVPFGKECTFMIGYRGLITLAHQSGVVEQIWSEVVYEDDEFDVVSGTDPRIIHRPNLNGDRSNEKIKAFYAVARVKGGTQFAWMTKAEVDHVRSRSRARKGGPWFTDYAEMGKKTVFKRLCKPLPMSSSDPLGRAIEIAEESDRLEYDTEPQDASAIPNGRHSLINHDEPTEEQLAAQPPFDAEAIAQEVPDGAGGGVG